MNTPIKLIDINPDYAARAMAFAYRNGWPTDFNDLAPEAFIGIIVDGLGYIAVIVDDRLALVLRYTSRELLRRLLKWPAAVDARVADLGYQPAIVPERTIGEFGGVS